MTPVGTFKTAPNANAYAANARSANAARTASAYAPNTYTGNGTAPANPGAANGTIIQRSTIPPPVYGPPMLTSNKDLPGPLSMSRLDDYGAVHQLDERNGYLCEYSDSLFGRGRIMTNVVPRACIACSTSALWTWMGGAFPDVIKVISDSHYRSIVYGRPIETFNRKAPPGQVSEIAGLRLTSPTRTACDIALLPDEEMDAKGRKETICAMIREYHIKAGDCLEILDANRFWHNAPRARSFFRAIQFCF
ncbi:hypothetical protein [Bifidobacterium sp. ESL0790]|uniref:hypothetical protein n=1 Tax=Bifidobacterium sp. ESL0790 TaxID=2983233 RepID=UPI0023F70A5C|nr:hypothetical protein [Bifidobacterium sp. ESL0790]WEV72556.1 hypothetical protein OZY47_00770 [Bifidobacterium sp. ESL0790]